MCSVRQSPIPSAPNATAFLTCSGVSAFARTPRRAEFVRPLHQFRVFLIRDAFLRIERAVHEHLNNLRRRGGDFAGKDFAGGTIDGNVIASIQCRAVRAECAFVVVDLDPGRAAHAHFAHLPRNQGRVRRNAAARRENPFSRDHAAQIFRRRFDAGEHDLFSVIRTRDSFFCAEHDMAARRARSSSETGPNFLRVPYCLAIKNWREEMRERIGRDTAHRVLFGYQFFADHVHGDTHRRMTGAFAVSGLQDVEAIFLDREFEVLHVLEVLFKGAANVHQLPCARRAFLSPDRRSDAACARQRPRLRPAR